MHRPIPRVSSFTSVSISILALCACLAPAAPAAAQAATAGVTSVLTPNPAGGSTLDLPVGQSRVLQFPNISRAAIGNPTVADIAVLSKTEILLNAKAAGETLLYVQNQRGAASIVVRVTTPPPTDLNVLLGDINRALQGTGATATVAGNTVFLRGQVGTAQEEQQAVAIAKAITPNVQSLLTVGKPTNAAAMALEEVAKAMGVTVRNPGENVMILEGATTTENAERLKVLAAQLGAGYQVVNLVTDDASMRQIVIHARVVELDQGAARDLGIDWGSLRVDDEGRLVGVGQPVIFGENRGSVIGAGKGGPIRRLENIGAAVQALETANRAKILSAPDILVRDGRPASILVGGEIPVPVPQVGAGANVIVIDYKEYGVRLQVTPKVLSDGTVGMRIEPEVSTLDYSNAIVVSGFRIPALRVRRAQTDVNVADGETLVLGGLLQDADVDSMRKIPILGDIPILGELFKFRSKTRAKTQLVILVTPEILPVGTRPNVPELAGLQPEPVKLPSAITDFGKEPGLGAPPKDGGIPMSNP